MSKTYWLNHFSFLIAATIITVFITDFLFYQHTIGWSLGIYAGLLSLLLLARSGQKWNIPHNAFLFICLMYLSLTAINEPSPLCLILLPPTLVTYAITTRSFKPNSLTQLIASWLHFLQRTIIQPVRDTITCYKIKNRRQSKFKIIKHLLYWLFPATLGIVFIALFKEANPIIASWPPIHTLHS